MKTPMMTDDQVDGSFRAPVADGTIAPVAAGAEDRPATIMLDFDEYVDLKYKAVWEGPTIRFGGNT